jgi:hypothetical protein
MSGAFTSAEQPQTAAILAAILDVATNHAGLTFAGSKLWAMPKATEIQAAGFPYFVVMQPRSVGGAIGGMLQGGDIPVLSESYEPVWEYDCYALFPFKDAGLAATYATPEDAKCKLIQAFVLRYTLENTCGKCVIVRPDVVSIEFVTGEEFMAAKLTLRCFEWLNVDNTPV